MKKELDMPEKGGKGAQGGGMGGSESCLHMVFILMSLSVSSHGDAD